MSKQRLDIYPTDDLLRALDRWRAAQPGLPPRAEAARRILTDRLGALGPQAKQKGKRNADKALD